MRIHDHHSRGGTRKSEEISINIKEVDTMGWQRTPIKTSAAADADDDGGGCLSRSILFHSCVHDDELMIMVT